MVGGNSTGINAPTHLWRTPRRRRSAWATCAFARKPPASHEAATSHMNIATPPAKAVPPPPPPPRATVSGIACLGAIARFHGLEFSDTYLIQVAAPGPNALFTPSTLVQVARKIGLTAKLVHMSWSRLGGRTYRIKMMFMDFDNSTNVITAISVFQAIAEIKAGDFDHMTVTGSYVDYACTPASAFPFVSCPDPLSPTATPTTQPTPVTITYTRMPPR